MKYAIFPLVLLLLEGFVGQAQSNVVSDALQQRNIRIWNAAQINTPLPEFSPTRYLGGIVFVSRRKQGPIDWETGKTYYELFYSELDANGIPGKRISFSPRINNPWLNQGPVAFSRAGDRMFYSQDNSRGGVSKADEEGVVWMKMYQAVKGDFDWEQITELPFNSDQYTCMHPALSPDGSALYFASNKPGGYGGMDLYVVKRQENGAWMTPINLGPEINTNKNEVFPFMHESGTLFFTSDGHEGFGGLDLFMIEMGGKRWGAVRNMGEPFNSKEDDLSLILNADGKRGYFASARPGGAGADDIYIFEIPEGLQGLGVTRKPTALLTVTDSEDESPLPGAAIRVFESTREGYLGDDALYELELRPGAATGGDMTLKMVRKNEEQLGPPKHFTNGNGQSLLDLEAEKNYLLLVSKPAYQTQELMLSASRLRENRPVVVRLKPRNCLVFDGKIANGQNGKGIPNARIRLYNRTTGEEEWLESNLEGRFSGCLSRESEYEVSARKEGYEAGDVRISTVNLGNNRSLVAEVRLRPVSNNVFHQPIKEGTVIVLRNIYYDFNKSAIRKGEARELMALAKMMKLYPSMEIELTAHTDSRGEADYNLELSLRRATSAKEFLVRQGIAAGRIAAIGFGEGRVRNHCRDGVPCSEEEHQFNRRTEVRVTHIDESVQIERPDSHRNRP